MNLNLTTRTALIVMGHVATLPKNQKIRSESLAQIYQLSPDYLMKILHTLCLTGLLESKRGMNGGYMLAKPAKDISLFEIINAACGPLQDFSVDESYRQQPLVQNLILTHNAATALGIIVLKKAKLSDMIKGKPRETLPVLP